MDSVINRIKIIVLYFLVGFPLLLTGQSPDDTTGFVYEPLQINEDFEITGTMDHPAWGHASSTLMVNQIQPYDDQAAPVETEVKVLYSRKNLYVGFVSKDPAPDRIRANVTDRDDFFGDDYIGIFLDPYNNNQNAYEFMVNPRGIQMDAMRNGNSENMNFDALWYSAASLTDSGYVTVMKIPFKSINFPNRDIQDWSIQFFRNYPRENRYQLSWTDVRVDNSCLLCQNGILANMRNVESSNTVEILPYAVTNQSASIEEPVSPESSLNNGPLEPKIGGSISYSPTSMSSLDVVVNPDFSQVETDAAQISVNETFALFYDEKRPFFVKGSDMFSTRENLYYSRTINNPLGAGKFTKKGDNFSLAILSAYDRDTPFIVTGKERSSQVRSTRDAYNNIVRGKYNLGSESHIGGLLTTRNQEDGYNYVGSIDWDFLLTDNYYFRGQAGYSYTRELDDIDLHDDSRTFGPTSYTAAFDGERYGGTLVSTEFSREAKYYNFSFDYESYSPTFQAQPGFINETNQRRIGGSQSLSYYPDTGILSQGSLSVSGTWRYDFAGEFQERYMFVRFNNSFAGQNSLSINFLPLNDERFRGTMFRNIHRGTISFSSNTWEAFSFGASVEAGRDIYRTVNPTLGRGYNISADATIKPTPRFQLTIDYSYSKLSEEDGSETFYAGDIYRLNTRYHFTSKLYTRLITEYDSFSDEFQVYPLLSYKANPFTKFYIGMTSYLTNFEFSDTGGFRDYRQTSREFFVKFQYLIRS